MRYSPYFVLFVPAQLPVPLFVYILSLHLRTCFIHSKRRESFVQMTSTSGDSFEFFKYPVICCQLPVKIRISVLYNSSLHFRNRTFGAVGKWEPYAGDDILNLEAAAADSKTAPVKVVNRSVLLRKQRRKLLYIDWKHYHPRTHMIGATMHMCFYQPNRTTQAYVTSPCLPVKCVAYPLPLPLFCVKSFGGVTDLSPLNRRCSRAGKQQFYFVVLICSVLLCSLNVYFVYIQLNHMPL